MPLDKEGHLRVRPQGPRLGDQQMQWGDIFRKRVAGAHDHAKKSGPWVAAWWAHWMLKTWLWEVTQNGWILSLQRKLCGCVASVGFFLKAMFTFLFIEPQFFWSTIMSGLRNLLDMFTLTSLQLVLGHMTELCCGQWYIRGNLLWGFENVIFSDI